MPMSPITFGEVKIIENGVEQIRNGEPTRHFAIIQALTDNTSHKIIVQIRLNFFLYKRLEYFEIVKETLSIGTQTKDKFEIFVGMLDSSKQLIFPRFKLYFDGWPCGNVILPTVQISPPVRIYDDVASITTTQALSPVFYEPC